MTLNDAAVRAHWTPVINVFDPFMPLLGPVLESCYVEREDSPLSGLMLSLRPDRVAQKVLLTGQRGCGKSSALVRLLHSLSEDYMVVWIDLERSLDLFRLSLLELMLALGGGVYKVALSTGLQPDPRPWEDIVNAVSTLVGQALRRADYALNADDLLRSVICARGDPVDPLDLRQADISAKQLDLDLSAEEQERLRVGTVLREMVSRINAIIADVELKAGRGLLVTVDGLDKMEPALAQSIFEYSSALVQIHCRTVYTLPYGLYKTSGFVGRESFDIHELPNVKLHARDDRTQRYEPGFEVMRQVVRLRLEALGVSVENIIAPEALDHLVWGSGGVMRSLIKLMRAAIFDAETAGKTSIDVHAAKHALQLDQRARSAALSPTALDNLRSFQSTGRMEDRWLSLLGDGNIVTYIDGGRVWYDIHPNALPLLED